MKVLFHIGIHKTGTSFLQQVLLPKLAKSNPDVEFLCPKHPFLTAYLHALWNEDYQTEFHDQHPMIIEWKKLCARGPRAILLSAELLASRFLADKYQEHFEFLSAFLAYVDVKPDIALVFREYRSYIESTYRHYLKRGVYVSLEELLYSQAADSIPKGYRQEARYYPEYSIKKLSFSGMANLYKSAFSTAFHAFFYEDFRSDPLAFSKALFAPLDLDLSALDTIDFSENKNSSPKYSLRVLPVALFWRRYFFLASFPGRNPKYRPLGGPFKQWLYRWVSRLWPFWNMHSVLKNISRILPKGKEDLWSVLNSSQRAELSDQFQRDSQALADCLGRPLPTEYLNLPSK